MANLEELKKQAAIEGIEITDDMLVEIAGGAYTDEEWNNMTTEERQAAQISSILARYRKQPCSLD